MHTLWKKDVQKFFNSILHWYFKNFNLKKLLFLKKLFGEISNNEYLISSSVIKNFPHFCSSTGNS